MQTVPLSQLKRTGDKKNSPFFEQYLGKIYAHKTRTGLQELLGNIVGFVLQTEHGKAVEYCVELSLMTAYRYHQTFENSTHRVHILKNEQRNDAPLYILLEPISTTYIDIFTHINSAYPAAVKRRNIKYIGEIYHTQDLQTTQDIFTAQGAETIDTPNAFLNNQHLYATTPSYYTNNTHMYTATNLNEIDLKDLDFGTEIELLDTEKKMLSSAISLQKKLGITGLIQGIDHLATRVLSGDREHALLEFISFSNYYFWGAYQIAEQNSSTNICRNPNAIDEITSPAKVFTANETPWYLNAITGLPSPTETFVRKFGKRMHHIAHAVVDGEMPDGRKNIDFVVQTLHENNVNFLAKVFGECKDIPDLKQIFSSTSQYSYLITEYVQRCKNFQGFFTKDNVADLTAAAGEDANLID